MLVARKNPNIYYVSQHQIRHFFIPQGGPFLCYNIVDGLLTLAGGVQKSTYLCDPRRVDQLVKSCIRH